MSLHAKTFLNFIAGGVAGLLAWLLTDGTGWYARTLETHSVFGPGLPGYGAYLFYGALFGLLLGLLLGIVDALTLDSHRQMVLTLALGAGIGFVGGALGLSLGQTVYGLLGGSDTGNSSPGRFLLTLVARAAGWAVIGAIIGAAQGVGRRSVIIVRQGAFGGLTGGLIGGLLFQLASVLLNSDVPSRLAALVATGALTGFFVGLVQDLFKQAWVKVMVGRGEGKEYLIAKPVTAIGRSELSDIGLFGDPSIAPTHAVIESLADQNRHRLRHIAGGQGAHAYPPTVVNGRPVTAEQWLTDGDTIQIGNRTLMFAEKATRSAPRPAPPAPNSGGARTPGDAVAVRYGMPAPPELGAGGPSQRPSLGMPPDVVAQMGNVPEPAVPLTPVLAQFSDSVTLKDFNITAVSQSQSQSPGAGSRLTATGGPYAGQSFPLSHLPTTLGRARDRDIPLSADSSVSRTHARVVYEGGQHQIDDDGSSNGTLVNGQRLSAPRPLRPGDVVRLGETELRYE